MARKLRHQEVLGSASANTRKAFIPLSTTGIRVSLVMRWGCGGSVWLRQSHRIDGEIGWSVLPRNVELQTRDKLRPSWRGTSILILHPFFQREWICRPGSK